MDPRAERLVMYGARAEADGLEWRWVADQLVTAGAYWVVTSRSDHPHPRPVWGIWYDDALHGYAEFLEQYGGVAWASRWYPRSEG